VKRGLLDYHFRGIQKFLQTPAVKNADVVHLHNLHGNYFNPFFLMDLSKIKPIVWTLHDMQAFTGHCAYSMGCDKWQYGCGDCPHLDTYPAVETDSTAKMLRDKGYIYGQTNMSVVAPSHWLYEMLQKSTLRKQKSYLLYNGVDTNIFHPLDREAVRSQLSIPPDALALGIVAHGGVTNCFKGGQSVLSVFREFANQRKCVLLNVGDDSPSTQPGIINVPRVVDEARLCELYNAMDIFLLPSEADNCPLVVLEALACGTPVAAFATGGIPELVRDNIDGVIVKNGDLNRLFKRIASLVDDKGAVAMSRSNARNRALSFAHEKMVDKYEAIYLETMRHWQAKYGDG
jgi:glycosyltransferase involved in cell wall biosynthesis